MPAQHIFQSGKGIDHRFGPDKLGGGLQLSGFSEGLGYGGETWDETSVITQHP